MGDQENKKQCFDLKSDPDFISNLPQLLKDNILMRLDIIEAVRTCILSKRWRYTWCTMPNLVIHADNFNIDCNKFIDSLLSNHKGPIAKLILSIVNFEYDVLDRWINVLGNKGVKILSFSSDIIDSCEIPASFFSCLLSLTDLKLRSRTLDVPQLFGGFKLLRNLELLMTRMDCADLERLVPRCPLLQRLKLEIIEGFNNLVIQSQSLETIILVGNYGHLALDTPQLSMLSGKPFEALFNKEKFKLVRVSYQTYTDGLLDLDSNLKALMVHLPKTVPIRKLPIKLNHLTEAVITIDVSKEDSLVSTLLLFKSAPKLQKLHLKFYGNSDLGGYSNCKRFWESEAKNVLFNDLKTVVIDCGLVTEDSTIAITKFILSTAPVLEDMNIIDTWVSFMVIAMERPRMLESVSQSDEGTLGKAMATVLEVLKLPRLSNKAHVAFEESEIFARIDQARLARSST